MCTMLVVPYSSSSYTTPYISNIDVSGYHRVTNYVVVDSSDEKLVLSYIRANSVLFCDFILNFFSLFISFIIGTLDAVRTGCIRGPPFYVRDLYTFVHSQTQILQIVLVHKNYLLSFHTRYSNNSSLNFRSCSIFSSYTNILKVKTPSAHQKVCTERSSEL